MEHDLYDKFVCYSKSIISDTEASISKAKNRLDNLKAYINEFDAGKLTFTADQEKLEGNLAAVMSEIANITGERNASQHKFEQNKQDLQSGIASLEAVAENLEETKKPPAVLLGLRGRSASGAIARRQHAELMKKGLSISDKHLSKANRLFLHRALAGTAGVLATDEQEPDDSTEAVVSMAAASTQSKDVVDSIHKVKEGMEDSLDQTIKNEEGAKKSFESILEAKTIEKEAAEEMLERLQAEHAGQAKTVAESQEEIEALTQQIEAEEKLIADTKSALEVKEKEFDERNMYRLGELKAVSEAVDMLRSDEARDFFREVASFLQTSSVSTQSKRASQVLFSLYSRSKDPRLLALNGMLHGFGDAGNTTGSFDEVIGKIDDMVVVLEQEEELDLEKKQNCTGNLLKDEASKKATERDIEALNSSFEVAEDKIEQIKAEIKDIEGQVADGESQLAKAEELRAAEVAEFNKSTQADQAAISLLKTAANSISSFYEQTKAEAALLQVNRSRDTPEVEGAPTWDPEPLGASAQSNGVVGALEMVAADLEKDMEVAKKQDAEAARLHAENKWEIEEQKALLQAQSDELIKSLGEKNVDQATVSDGIASKSKALAALVQKMEDRASGCDDIVEGFEKRSKSRNDEVDGLKQAKVVLQSANEDAAPTVSEA
eukprot:TRINITY_DN28335_c0_g1_i1.p1 TRINITY_DN28335_c0_g1~~TRINITY_DN28335_c0_g1_i1.p1  ORF type:complete len:663 (+),score=227.58 TRINITY_DN28335_c0_g1_i1:96-2084(+)